jgi:hypothetical protein
MCSWLVDLWDRQMSTIVPPLQVLAFCGQEREGEEDRGEERRGKMES